MKKAKFAITRDNTSRATTFTYETVDGTAIAGRDYTAIQGVVDFSPTVTTATIEVDVADRPVNALDREFKLKLKATTPDTVLSQLQPSCKLITTEDLSNLTWGETVGHMFDPKYWTIDSQSTESCAIISSGESLTAYMTNRTKSGLAGVIWDTSDKYDHTGIGYKTNRNLSHAKLDFRIELSPGVPDFSNTSLTPTLTLELMNGTIHYIPLYPYASDIAADSKSATVKLDFSTLKSGPNVDIPVDTTQVKQFFFSLISEEYVEDDAVVPLTTNKELTMKISMMQPSTGWTPMVINNLTVTPHQVRMCTSYDDMYNLTPARVIENTMRLGYRDMINHYNGMSHYYEFAWNGSAWALNRTQFLNSATQAWLVEFYTLAKLNGFQVINSISFELMSTVCPAEWVQHDWNDALAATGYTPPSWVLSPSIEGGMDYLKGVITFLSNLCEGAGLGIIIQIGEPWWWYNTATKLPCIYDYTTKVAFNAATGLFAQDIGTIDNYHTGTPYDEYMAFLEKTLGDRVVKFGTDLKISYPNAKITLLPFLPSIIGNGMMEYVNFPTDHYTPVNFDFYCSECYDWLLQGLMTKSFQAITIPNQQLGFSYDQIHYLAGFVPDETLAPIYGFDPASNYREYLWKMIFGNIVLNEQKFPGLHQYIWAYPQIMHDSITVHNSQSRVFHMGSIAYEGYLEDTPFPG